jgi:hypothetical protein
MRKSSPRVVQESSPALVLGTRPLCCLASQAQPGAVMSGGSWIQRRLGCGREHPAARRSRACHRHRAAALAGLTTTLGCRDGAGSPTTSGGTLNRERSVARGVQGAGAGYGPARNITQCCQAHARGRG